MKIQKLFFVVWISLVFSSDISAFLEIEKSSSREQSEISNFFRNAAFDGKYKKVVSLNRQNRHNLQVDSKGPSGETALILAAREGNLAIVKYLLKSGADVNVTDNSKSNALFYAAQNGHTKVVKFLIDSGINVNATNIENLTPIMRPCAKGYVEIVKSLIAAGASVNSCRDWHNFTPLMHAIQNGHCEVVRLLLKAGADVNMQDSKDRTPLSLAASLLKSEFVGNIAFFFSDLPEIICLLCAAGACSVGIDGTFNFDMHYLAKENFGLYSEFVWKRKVVNLQELIGHGLKVYKMIFSAVKNGDISVIKEIHRAGYSLNVRDELGNSPLHYAVQNGNKLMSIAIYRFNSELFYFGDNK